LFAARHRARFNGVLTRVGITPSAGTIRALHTATCASSAPLTMAKKKAPTAAPLQCFAGTRIAIVGGEKSQRKIWAAKTGCVDANEADLAFVVVANNIDEMTQIDTSATLVAESWLLLSLAQRALADPAAHPWPRFAAAPAAAAAPSAVDLTIEASAPAAPSPLPKRARLDDESDDVSDAEPSMPDTTDAIRALALAPAAQRARPVPGRHGLIADLDYGVTPGARYAAIVDGVLTAGDAAWLIRQAPAAQDPYTGEQGYRLADVNGVIDETCRKSGRVCVDVPALADQVFERLRPALLATWRWRGTWRLKGLNERFRFLRYGRRGDFVHPHRDGPYKRSDVERSFVTLLLYLNEGYSGAWTTIYNPSSYGGGVLAVPPTVGMALLRDHNLYHEVPELLAGVKYVIRTDVMYERVGDE